MRLVTLVCLIALSSSALAEPAQPSEPEEPKTARPLSFAVELHAGFPTGLGGLPVAVGGTLIVARIVEVSVGGMWSFGSLWYGAMLRVASPQKHAVTVGVGVNRSYSFDDVGCENCHDATLANFELGYRYMDPGGFLFRAYVGPRLKLTDGLELEPFPYGGIAIGWVF